MAEIEKFFVVGGGGRETEIMREAIAEGVPNVYSTRSEDAVNIGLEGVINTGLGEKDIEGITSWARQEGIDLVAIGPEAPLVNGLADSLRASGVPAFGPGADGAIFEADKTVTHRLAIEEGLNNPPNSETFSPEEADAAKAHIREVGVEDVFTKRVGLEGGKGARHWDSEEEAFAEVDAVAAKGEDLLIQGRLLGPEYSGMFMLDGRSNAVALPLSRDHKSLYDGGQGPNTGGMGAYAPLSYRQASFNQRFQMGVMGQTFAEAMAKEGIDYRGIAYLAFMAMSDDPTSQLCLIEINVRFGDPEAQVVIPTLRPHMIELMAGAAHGSLDHDMNRLYDTPDNLPVVTSVCLASPGYAQDDAELITGLPITVPKDLPDEVFVHFAGAKMVDGKPVSTGGRVAYVTQLGGAPGEVYNYIGRENGGVYLGDDQQVIRTDIGKAL